MHKMNTGLTRSEKGTMGAESRAMVAARILGPSSSNTPITPKPATPDTANACDTCWKGAGVHVLSPYQSAR
jgi:hypothetical protein